MEALSEWVLWFGKLFFAVCGGAVEVKGGRGPQRGQGQQALQLADFVAWILEGPQLAFAPTEGTVVSEA